MDQIAISGWYEVEVDELRRIMDPLDGAMWKIDPITVQDVQSYHAVEIFAGKSWQDVNGRIQEHLVRVYHIARIAALVAAPPCKNDPRRITLLLSNAMGNYFVDGNHRFAAAIVRGDPKITVCIVDGDDLISTHLLTAKSVP
jgi:hypothetical protein